MARFTGFIFLTASLLVGACSEHDYIYGQITQHNGKYTGIASTGEDLSSSSEWTETTGTTADDVEVTYGTGYPDSTDAADPFELVVSASSETLEHAGSIVLTLEVTGQPTSLDLFVRGDVTTKIEWPLGQESLEYIVDNPQANGTLLFRVIGQDGHSPPASDTTEVEVALPESGSVVGRAVGAAETSGRALVVQKQMGIDGDRVFAIGNHEDEVAIGELVSPGELLPMVVDSGEHKPLWVEAAAALADGSLAVVGNVEEHAEVRRYKQVAGTWVLWWDLRLEHTEVHDVEVGPSDQIYVAGARIYSDHTDAAAWVLTESGGTVLHDTYEAKDSDSKPLSSALFAVAVDQERALWAGESQVHLSGIDRPFRGGLFEFEDSGLTLVDLQGFSSPKEHSGWRAVAFAEPSGLVALGWYRYEPNGPKRELSRAAFTSSLFQGPFVTKKNHAGNAIAWHPGSYAVIAGQGSVYPDFNADPWAGYLDIRPGAIQDIAIDRHGYTYFVGRIHIDGTVHSVVWTANP